MNRVKRMISLLIVFMIVSIIWYLSYAEEIELTAKAAILVDMENRSGLYENNADMLGHQYNKDNDSTCGS